MHFALEFGLMLLVAAIVGFAAMLLSGSVKIASKKLPLKFSRGTLDEGIAQYFHEMSTLGVKSDAPNLLWNLFLGWMSIQYPLLSTDIVRTIIELEDRELLELIEETVLKKYSLEIVVPDEYLDKTLADLTLYLDRELRHLEEKQGAP